MGQITAYLEEDHDYLVELWYRAVRETHAFLTEADIAFYRQIVDEQALKHVEVWVEKDDSGVPLGFIGLDGSMVEMLFVDPDRHGQGIGTRLLRYAEQLKGSRLRVDVNEQNDGAYAFYQRYGFVRTGRSELDGSGRPFPLLHLELKR
ncbi:MULTISPECIES: GNAT family N-acetyltransferase [Paenibacillus]|uniref:GNAT family N-acetyltransferase n=1 Tax=Paenibacillus TaxID=44249 RepID=UPI000CF95966|nr:MULTISPECIES: GNAT family N-acetyltransferase [Paenibacillus]MBJ9992557.1 GNAT family N-acetyltransferase [Paenibacillus sp. S28]PQP90534.1 GNAT family N-acetyltransferase [Paenibacillus sp. AR247]